jgi:hypothetical protein
MWRYTNIRFERLPSSPFEPAFLHHFRKAEGGKIRWDVEVEEPHRYVAGGLADSLKDADAQIEAAISADLDDLMGSYGLPPRDPELDRS